MTTPTKWVMEDGLEEEKAHAILDGYAENLSDDTVFVYEELIEDCISELVEEGLSEIEAREKHSWFKGAGFYENNTLIYRLGDCDLRNDVVLYRIEEHE